MVVLLSVRQSRDTYPEARRRFSQVADLNWALLVVGIRKFGALLPNCMQPIASAAELLFPADLCHATTFMGLAGLHDQLQMAECGVRNREQLKQIGGLQAHFDHAHGELFVLVATKFLHRCELRKGRE